MRKNIIAAAAVAGIAALGAAGCGTGTPTAAPAATSPAAPGSDQPTTTTTSTGRTVPAVGTVLQQFSGSGSVIAGGSGFSYLEASSSGMGANAVDQSTITTYAVDGSPLAHIGGGTFTGTCGAADVVTNGRRTILTELLTTQPAQGINPAQYSADIDAWDAATGEHLWKSTVVSPQTGQLGCQNEGGPLKSVSVTGNGAWALYAEETGNLDVRAILDLSTGKFRTDGRSVGILGDYIVDGDPTGNSSSDEVIDPAIGRVLGSFPTDTSSGGIPVPHSPPLAAGRVYSADTGSGPEEIRISADGKTLFARQTSNDNGDQGYAIAAHSLPDMNTLWKIPAPNDNYQILGADAGLLLVEEQPDNGTANLVALAEKTGKEAWRLPAGQVCGTTSSQLLISVNQQLATIDLASGQQVSYTNESSCPTLLAGGITVSESNNEITVAQTLKP